MNSRSRKTVVVLIHNWMGGTNILTGLSSILGDENPSIISPEIEAWKNGINLHEEPSNLKIPFNAAGNIIYFRSPLVCLQFLKNAEIEKQNLSIGR